MSKISSMMDVGKRSLSNSQTALQTVAHNIANKTTEGYSRQRVELTAATPINEGRMQIGMGARASQVTRTNNPWLEKQIQKENMNLGYQDSKAESLARVEQVYNEQLNKGLNIHVVEFFNAFRELANDPESLVSRTLVRENSDVMIKDFKRVNGQLESVQDDLDNQIKNVTGEINEIIKELADLNQRIQSVEIQNIPANDERDRRDVLLKHLGEKIDISWAEGTDGMVTVTAAKNALLVTGTTAAEIKAKQTDDRDRVELFYIPEKGKTPVNITDRVTGGRIGGALEVRDQFVEKMKSNLDTVAYSLMKEVNKAHIEGFDRYGKKAALFFEMPDVEKGAAAKIELNQTISNDVGRIAAAARPNASGDNTVANLISSLQYSKMEGLGKATIDDFYNTQVGMVGTMSQRAKNSLESQKEILKQFDNIRESISGVSLDEETTKMLEFQKAYDASARLIRTADEMLDTVINLKRL
ncbi:MAG TPA: flagellar hook-associated protein FlgK [Pseudobdellovibrionaceae bacterium]|jgi:flagellar hook-associated protein 1 FlgK|nr:flagellar hook-associated protein FlgK [Pseudobdellovibrionaceae bacterium]